MLGRLAPLALLLAVPLALAQEDEEEGSIDFSHLEVSGAPMKMRMSATPGGAQDARYFRTLVGEGQVPAPDVITAEGLLSEHDLPGPDIACERLICPTGQAIEARIGAQPEVRWLAQLGFTSSLDASTFERPPLSLIAVVDRSCSMSGGRFETVRASLEVLARDLGPDDRLAIVTYGSSVDTELSPTSARDPAVARAIEGLAIAGSTNMEAGLTRGFELARQERRRFDGVTRVMLFTDERPNTGRTDARGFMAMAEAASHDGVGLTTVGVGLDFGAALAQKVSNVRGGNLFYFSDLGEMQETFAAELDTMVVELAYDLSIEVRPASGTRIAGVYGIPGDAFTWTEAGGLRTEVKTLFASRRGGGVFFAFAPEGEARVRPGLPVGSVALSYTSRDGGPTDAVAPFVVVPDGRASRGLTVGSVLVDEYAALKLAAIRHHEGDPAGARAALAPVGARLSAIPDAALAKELDLVRTLEATLAAGSGQVASVGGGTSGIDGLPGR